MLEKFSQVIDTANYATNTKLTIWNNGTIYYPIPLEIKVSCQYDVSAYPND